jgi:hypothetical protein
MRLAYVLLKAKYTIEPEVKTIKALNGMLNTDGMKQFNILRTDLCMSCVDRDEKGDPLFIDGNYKITEYRSKFDRNIEYLTDMYKVELSIYESKKIFLDALMAEDIKIELPKGKLAWLPKGVSIEAIDVLKYILVGG